MMDWDRPTQTGARTPGCGLSHGPILRYRCGLRSRTQCWGFCGRRIDTKDGGKLEEHFAHAGSELKRMAHRKVPSDMHTFLPYWGKPAVRNDREGRGNVGIIRSPVRATILLAEIGAVELFWRAGGGRSGQERAEAPFMDSRGPGGVFSSSLLGAVGNLVLWLPQSTS